MLKDIKVTLYPKRKTFEISLMKQEEKEEWENFVDTHKEELKNL
jgi:hypothetical protein